MGFNLAFKGLMYKDALKVAVDVGNINVMRGIYSVNDFHEICYLKFF